MKTIATWPKKDAVESPAQKALRTAKWARIMTKWLISHSSSPLQNWITRELVPRISNGDDVVWIIAGHRTPSVELGGANWLLRQRVKPLTPECSREYLMQIKLEWEEKLIKFITLASDGNPQELQCLAMYAMRM